MMMMLSSYDNDDYDEGYDNDDETNEMRMYTRFFSPLCMTNFKVLWCCPKRRTIFGFDDRSWVYTNVGTTVPSVQTNAHNCNTLSDLIAFAIRVYRLIYCELGAARILYCLASDCMLSGS
ncbi:hypothetical protein DPMN_023702 [Dreissena polymorpha]|uniref:Uncharacterized protein n=1 Tax=Dreissena polymorpha TaxID=45954 RepID=A0A9D4LNE4_DREPO|nr:hypothetical protein DPMN_023702 [Dreissena polymorpha]